MPSPFPPIADYAFLSNCHTGALVAPDGAIDWLCVPRFDAPSIFGSILDRGAGSFRLAPFGIAHSDPADVRAGNQRPRDDLEDAVGMDRGSRCAHDGADAGGGHDHAPYPTACGRRRGSHARAHRRMPRRSCRDRAHLRAGFRLRQHARGRGPSSKAVAMPLTRASRGRPCVSGRISRSGSRGTGFARATCSSQGERAFCALSWADGAGNSGGRRRRDGQDRGDDDASGAPGSGAHGFPTTVGALRSSAPRWPSRV